MFLYLKRRGSFSAAHSYWLPKLTPDENRSRFGPWLSKEGHGHNYVVEVTVGGSVDLSTGMVVNITDVNRALQTEVIGYLNGRFLNREIPYFEDHPPTCENIAYLIWHRLEPELPTQGKLRDVSVWEMPTLRAQYGQNKDTMMLTSLTRSYDFSAAHRLHSLSLDEQQNQDLFGKCNNPHGHGHNYEVEVTLSGEPDHTTGMLYPLDQLDQIVDEEVLKPFDHKHLNLDTIEFAEINPTSEMLTVVIWNKLAKKIPVKGNPRLTKVLVRETARNSFEYCGETSY